MLKLGSIHLDVPFLQAPLSGYSDRAMRLLARQYGAPMTFAGVILAKVAMHPAVFKKPGIAVQDDEHPIGGQLLGTDPRMMAKAATELVNVGYDLIDLNFACPAPKVLRRHRGGYMINEPQNVMAIYRQVRDAVDCPVLIKLRIGFDETQASSDCFWQICECASAERIDALVVHGRSVQAKFRGKADWQIISEVKRRFPETTLIGSGDLFTAEAAVDRLTHTGVDGVIIARGAVGNPWIFSQIRALLEGNPKPPPPTIAEQGETMLKHFELVNQIYHKNKAVTYFRKFSAAYARHHPERKTLQRALVTARNYDEFIATAKQWYQIG